MDAVNDRAYVIGCDLGGANLKVADTLGKCASRAFPMWLKADQLAVDLREMLNEFPVTSATRFALTMTGELADCFATRRDGVRHIITHVEQAIAPAQAVVYALGNRWLSAAEAIATPWDVAASNWHALATWIGTFPNQLVDLVLDIGSTTVDIIPMRPNRGGFAVPATNARTDRQRLELGQLIYTGLERTPVAAIVPELNVEGRGCPVMAERFATSDDCYLLLNLTPEAPHDFDTADHRPRTIQGAYARLARMIGEDSETLPLEAALDMAEQVIDRQAEQVAQAIYRNLPAHRAEVRVVAVGHGRALAQRALAKLSEQPFIVTWLAELFTPLVSRTAPAIAVAALLAAHEGTASCNLLVR